MLILTADKQFSQSTNDTLIQSGTYTTGHGVYLPYTGAIPYIFDSICYFVSGTKVSVDYYSIQHSDTLIFSGSFSGKIGGGSKYYKKLF